MFVLWICTCCVKWSFYPFLGKQSLTWPEIFSINCALGNCMELYVVNIYTFTRHIEYHNIDYHNEIRFGRPETGSCNWCVRHSLAQRDFLRWSKLEGINAHTALGKRLAPPVDCLAWWASWRSWRAAMGHGLRERVAVLSVTATAPSFELGSGKNIWQTWNIIYLQ